MDLNKTTKLEHNQYLEFVQPALLKLFITDNPNPYGTPIKPDAPIKKLVFDWWAPPSLAGTNLLGACQKASSDFGERGFYLRSLSRDQNEKSKPESWFIHYSDSQKFGKELKIYFENVSCSTHGLWAVVLSYDDHGLLVCTKDVYAQVRVAIPDLDLQINTFIEYWKKMEITYHNSGLNKSDAVSWIYPQLVHIYGMKKAKDILLDHHCLHWMKA